MQPNNWIFFQNMMLECQSLWSWTVREGKIVSTNCPDSGSYTLLIQENAGKADSVPSVMLPEGGYLLAEVRTVDGTTYLLGPGRDLYVPETPRNRDLPILDMLQMQRYSRMLAMAVGMAIPSRENTPPADRFTVLLSRFMQAIREGQLVYNAYISAVLSSQGLLSQLGVYDGVGGYRLSLMVFRQAGQAAVSCGVAQSAVDAVTDKYAALMTHSRSVLDYFLCCEQCTYQILRLVRKQKGGSTFEDPALFCCIYIVDHIYEPISVKQLAIETGYSPDHLLKLFRRELGMNLKDFILRKKVLCAQLLLTCTTQTAGEIASRLAFCSGSHMAEIFRRFVGETPSAYRIKYTHRH